MLVCGVGDTLVKDSGLCPVPFADAMAPQMIVDDPTLQRITKARPSSIEKLIEVEGVPEASARQHGPELLQKVCLSLVAVPFVQLL